MADAIRAATITPVSGSMGQAYVISWTGLDSDDSGSPVQLNWYSDRSVQIVGTFGSGGSVTIQGSNDGTNYVALTDPQGNVLTKTSAALESIAEATKFIRPIVTAGDGTTSLSVYIFVTGGRRT